MGSGTGAKDSLQGAFFIHLFKDYLSGAIPKYKTIDGAIERLNRRTLTTIFILLCVVATQDGILGAKIHCNGFESFKRRRFVKGLFTNRFAYHKPPEQLPGPGVVPCIRAEDGFKCSNEEKAEQQVYHLWYQWVPMYFALSAAAFYFPHIITKITIVGKLSRFVDELQRPEELLGDNGSAARLGSMMARWAKLNLNGRYGESIIKQYRVPAMELLSKMSFLAMSIFHFWITAKMFPIGNYYKLGLLWHRPSTDNYTHIGDVLFPKLVGCNIKKYSLSGLNEESGMCTLPPNVVFQYLFLITWWCVVIISGLNAVNLIKSVIVMTANECGYKMYRYNLEVTYDKKRGNQDINDMFRGPTKDDTKLVFAYYDLSSQIVFHKISDNVHPAIMAFGIKYMAENIKEFIRKDSDLADFVRSELAKKHNSPITSPMEEQPGPSEQSPGLSLNLSKGKRKGYKKVERVDTEV
ncbi:hypothetical protein ACHWQZ_G016952 [Mnemiopsis leidyi]